jgi:hypothetical protein
MQKKSGMRPPKSSTKTLAKSAIAIEAIHLPAVTFLR